MVSLLLPWISRAGICQQFNKPRVNGKNGFAGAENNLHLFTLLLEVSENFLNPFLVGGFVTPMLETSNSSFEKIFTSPECFLGPQSRVHIIAIQHYIPNRTYTFFHESPHNTHFMQHFDFDERHYIMKPIFSLRRDK